MKLSEKIFKIRKARGLTQEELGALLGKDNNGISRQSVSTWETGANEPTLNNLRDIAKVLHVSVGVLVDESIDLNDESTMLAVLRGEPLKTQEHILARFYYEVRSCPVKRIPYIPALVVLIFLAAAIVFTVLAFAMNITFFVFGSVAWVLFIPFVVNLVEKLKAMIHPVPGPMIALLNVDGMTVYVKNQAENTIFIPYGKIEKLELVGKQTKSRGNVDIIVKGRKEPLTLTDVYKPAELLELFGKIDSYIEGSDGNGIL